MGSREPGDKCVQGGPNVDIHDVAELSAWKAASHELDTIINGLNQVLSPVTLEEKYFHLEVKQAAAIYGILTMDGERREYKRRAETAERRNLEVASRRPGRVGARGPRQPGGRHRR